MTTRRRSCTAASARVFALPTDLGALDRGAAAGPGLVQQLDRGAAAGPGLVQQLEVEQAFEGGEGFGGAGHGGG